MPAINPARLSARGGLARFPTNCNVNDSDPHHCFTSTPAVCSRDRDSFSQIAVVPDEAAKGANRPSSARQCVLSTRRNAVVVPTWGTAVVRAFHTTAQGGPLGVTHEQSAGAVVYEPPVVVAVRARPGAARARRVAVAPHEQLGAVGESEWWCAGGCMDDRRRWGKACAVNDSGLRRLGGTAGAMEGGLTAGFGARI